MDRVISSRIDETVVALIDSLSRQLHTPKKRIIEEAITRYASALPREAAQDVFGETCGCWTRDEPPEQTVALARQTFRESMCRDQA